MSTKTVVRAGAAALAAAAAAPAVAETVYSNGNGGTVSFYGHLNPTFQSFDDGEQRYDGLADNANANSRIGMDVTQSLGEDTFRFKFETGLGLRSSAGISQDGKPAEMSWDRTDIRHVDFAYDSARFGTFSAGQGSMASDGAAGADLSGTGVIQSLFISDSAGGFKFRDSAGNLTGPAIEDAFAAYDGSRLGRVRYDSVDVNGFTFSASYGEEVLDTTADFSMYDVTARYENENVGAFAVAAAVGYGWEEDAGVKSEAVNGSFSVLHKDSGLSFSAAAGEKDTAGTYGYAKVGYTTDLISVGATSFGVDYYNGDDTATAGSEASSWGIAAVQSFDKAGIDAYVAYREYSYDDNAATYQDASSILAGAMIKF